MLRWVWLSVLVVALDQASKAFVLHALAGGAAVGVTPFLNFVLAFNTGAAFSFLHNAGGWQYFLFVGIALVVSVAIVAMLYRLKPSDRWVAIALALILGGALGNLIDRLRFGFVVDFIDVYYRSWHWYTFNLADAAITIGAAMLLLDTFGAAGRRERSEP